MKGGDYVQSLDGVIKNVSAAVGFVNKSGMDWNNTAKFLEDRGFRPLIKLAQSASAETQKFFGRIITYTNFELSMKMRMLMQIMQVLKDILDEIRKLGKRAVSKTINILTRLQPINNITTLQQISQVSILNDHRVYSYIRQSWVGDENGAGKKEKKSFLESLWDTVKGLIGKVGEKLFDRVLERLFKKYVDPLLDKFSFLKIKDGANTRINVICKCLCGNSAPKGSTKSGRSGGPSSGNKTASPKSSAERKSLKSGKIQIPRRTPANAIKPNIKLPGILSRLSVVGKAAKKIPLLGLAASAFDIATAADKKRAVVTNAGGWAGAAAGAAIGTAVVPVIGTAVGGIIGGIVGGIGGEKIAGFVYDNWSKIKSTASKVFNRVPLQNDPGMAAAIAPDESSKSYAYIKSAALDIKSARDNLEAYTRQLIKSVNNNFNITINGVNKTTDQIMNELVKKISEAANIMGEAVVT